MNCNKLHKIWIDKQLTGNTLYGRILIRAWKRNNKNLSKHKEIITEIINQIDDNLNKGLLFNIKAGRKANVEAEQIHWKKVAKDFWFPFFRSCYTQYIYWKDSWIYYFSKTTTSLPSKQVNIPNWQVSYFDYLINHKIYYLFFLKFDEHSCWKCYVHD